jgi:hypothetical protein
LKPSGARIEVEALRPKGERRQACSTLLSEETLQLKPLALKLSMYARHQQHRCWLKVCHALNVADGLSSFDQVRFFCSAAMRVDVIGTLSKVIEAGKYAGYRV